MHFSILVLQPLAPLPSLFQNYSSIITVHPEIIDGRPGTLVIESFVVDVPDGNTKDETCYFVEALIKCNLKSLADVSERLAVQDRTEPIDRIQVLWGWGRLIQEGYKYSEWTMWGVGCPKLCREFGILAFSSFHCKIISGYLMSIIAINQAHHSHLISRKKGKKNDFLLLSLPFLGKPSLAFLGDNNGACIELGM